MPASSRPASRILKKRIETIEVRDGGLFRVTETIDYAASHSTPDFAVIWTGKQENHVEPVISYHAELLAPLTAQDSGKPAASARPEPVEQKLASASDNGFRCPECLGTSPGATMLVSPDPSGGKRATTPWAGVLKMIECADCSTGIPAHLAERWNGISLDQAHEDWKTIFRPTRRAADEGGQDR